MIVNEDVSSKQLRIIGEVEVTLNTNSKGICKCSQCGKIFSTKEQKKLHRLVTYLNTPHYWLEEDMKYHNLWRDVLEYYNHGYLEKDKPLGLFSVERAVNLSKGVEPVLFHRNHYNNSWKKILTAYSWKNGEWIIENKFLMYLKLLLYKKK